MAVYAAAALLSPAPAAAQAGPFTLINATEIDFTGLAVRRFGTDEWRPLVVAPVPVGRAGGRGSAQFTSEDCAFDLRATLPDGRMVLWSGVNLCDAKVVKLSQNARGLLWVDYE